MENAKNRFVVQAHRQADRPAHFDLMLERDGALATWSFDSEPWGTTPQPGSRGKLRRRAERRQADQWRLHTAESSRDGERRTGEAGREVRGIPCMRLGAHRLRYLDFEGDIGGGRGTVQIVDKGAYSTEEWNEQRVAVKLQGSKMRGVFKLVPVRAG